jgi:hypothetical protein
MAKKIVAGLPISPTNLWGKPLPRPTNKPPEKKVAGMTTEDNDIMEDEDIDVDAELADADEDIVDDEPVEAETVEVTAELDEEESEEDEVDEEGLTFAAEDGDADDELVDDDVEEEQVVSAVEDDEEEEPGETEELEVAATTTESKRVMANKTKEKVSLSDHVRNEIEKRKSAGASLRGKDIVAALEKRNISVSPAQVSQLLKKAGLGGAKRGRAPAAATETTTDEKSRVAMKAKKRGEMTLKIKPAAKPAPVAAQPRSALKAAPTASGHFRVPVDQLQAAEAFVAACGGCFEKATRILTTAAQLSDAFSG